MVFWFWLRMDEDAVDDHIQHREVRTVDARWFTTSQLCNSVNKFKGGYKMKELAVKALGLANQCAITSRHT
eukprot:4503956-Pyramimonas_sp.AAC.1